MSKKVYKFNTVERIDENNIIVTSNKTRMAYPFNVSIGDVDKAPKFCRCGSRSIATRGSCTHMDDIAKFLKEERAEELAHTKKAKDDDNLDPFGYGIPIFAS